MGNAEYMGTIYLAKRGKNLPFEAHSEISTIPIAGCRHISATVFTLHDNRLFDWRVASCCGTTKVFYSCTHNSCAPHTELGNNDLRG